MRFAIKSRFERSPRGDVRLGLVVSVLTRLEVEELSVGEHGEVVLETELLLAGARGALGLDGVEVTQILRNIGASTAVVAINAGF
ncbi:hypothetical protein HYQ46_010407 [Verticillium longisporum]|nr:hypothetical protein HYQ46_010407 [Verticillium longisporum]